MTLQMVTLASPTAATDPCADLLDQAKAAVCGPRRAIYGDPADDMETTAALWSAWISRRHGIALELTGGDVAILMVLLKTSRLAKTPEHVDSALDIAGYAACLHSCQRRDGAKAPE